MRAVPWILVVLSGAIAFLLWLTRPTCEDEHRQSARCPDTRSPARQGRNGPVEDSKCLRNEKLGLAGGW